MIFTQLCIKYLKLKQDHTMEMALDVAIEFTRPLEEFVRLVVQSSCTAHHRYASVRVLFSYWVYPLWY